jgi:hypothetical protein
MTSKLKITVISIVAGGSGTLAANTISALFNEAEINAALGQRNRMVFAGEAFRPYRAYKPYPELIIQRDTLMKVDTDPVRSDCLLVTSYKVGKNKISAKAALRVCANS